MPPLKSQIQNLQNWFKSERASAFSGRIAFDELLSLSTYYRIGGPAAVVATPANFEDLRILELAIKEVGAPFFILGRGSNVLAADEGYPGLVIRNLKLNLQIEALSENRIRTGGSVGISTLLNRASTLGLGGLEFLTGIPGTVGGAIRMNAGTHLGQSQDRVRLVEAVDLSKSNTLSKFEGNDLKFEYRKNLFLNPTSLVWAVEWEVVPTPTAEVKSLIDATLLRRKSTQPLDTPSCGSVFKNPKSSGLSAWQVIEKLGLKGHRIGNAQFSEKHCNFIVNLGNAKASDVKALIDLAISKSKTEAGILLEPEVVVLQNR